MSGGWCHRCACCGTPSFPRPAPYEALRGRLSRPAAAFWRDGNLIMVASWRPLEDRQVLTGWGWNGAVRPSLQLETGRDGLHESCGARRALCCLAGPLGGKPGPETRRGAMERWIQGSWASAWSRATAAAREWDALGPDGPILWPIVVQASRWTAGSCKVEFPHFGIRPEYA